MHIRHATPDDRQAIEDIYTTAFPENERTLVAQLAIRLLGKISQPATLSFVAENDAIIYGHVAFSPVTFCNAPHLSGSILAPLAVHPEFQKRRVGTQLVEYGIQQVMQTDAAVVFVYGDPGYYGKFEFSAEAAQPYAAPYTLQYPLGWQARMLKEVDAPPAPSTIACVDALCDATLW